MVLNCPLVWTIFLIVCIWRSWWTTDWGGWGFVKAMLCDQADDWLRRLRLWDHPLRPVELALPLQPFEEPSEPWRAASRTPPAPMGSVQACFPKVRTWGCCARKPAAFQAAAARQTLPGRERRGPRFYIYIHTLYICRINTRCIYAVCTRCFHGIFHCIFIYLF